MPDDHFVRHIARFYVSFVGFVQNVQVYIGRKLCLTVLHSVLDQSNIRAGETVCERGTVDRLAAAPLDLCGQDTIHRAAEDVSIPALPEFLLCRHRKRELDQSSI